MRRRLRFLIPAILVVGAALAFFAACSPARVIESARIVDDIRAGSAPSLLKDVRPEPARTAVVYEIDGMVAEGDLYQPADAILARIVLVPGVTPAGRNDRRLVEFAMTLARARFEVLVPDLVEMRELRVSAEEAVPIANAVMFLDRAHDDRPLGIAAVSFAVGPALISLFDPDAGPRVDFVLAIGGYYDLEALITFITTGYHRGDRSQPWQYLGDSRLAKWVFLFSNASRIEDEADRQRLQEMARRRMADPGADITDVVAQLGPEGRSTYAVFSNTDPDQAERLWLALPVAIREEAARLDLRNWQLEDLSAHFILIHDRNDRVVPADHSRWLMAALPAGRVEAFLIGSLRHADPQPPGFRDAFTMLRAVYAVLTERDRARKRYAD